MQSLQRITGMSCLRWRDSVTQAAAALVKRFIPETETLIGQIKDWVMNNSTTIFSFHPLISNFSTLKTFSPSGYSSFLWYIMVILWDCDVSIQIFGFNTSQISVVEFNLLKYKTEVSVLWVFSFILLLHFSSEGVSVPLTALHLSDSFSYSLLSRFRPEDLK